MTKVIFYNLITFQNQVKRESSELGAVGHMGGRYPLWAGGDTDKPLARETEQVHYGYALPAQRGKGESLVPCAASRSALSLVLSCPPDPP